MGKRLNIWSNVVDPVGDLDSANRNRLINGDMRIDQRNSGASITPSASPSAVYSVDRWKLEFSVGSKLSCQQNAGAVTPPDGFTYYLGLTSLGAYTIGAGDYFVVSQGIEGLNVSDLRWGSATAQAGTLSFWVRSSLTGTFGGCVQNSAQNRSYPFQFNINSASTWEKKTISIPGDTTGTWLTDTGVGIWVRFGLGVGSTYSGPLNTWAGANYYAPTGATSVVATNGATFQVTGVQFKDGSDTPFEFLNQQTTLLNCSRYAYVLNSGGGNTPSIGGYMVAGGNAFWILQFPVIMRVAPTITIAGTWATVNCGQPQVGAISQFTANIYVVATATGVTQSYPNTSDDLIIASADF